MWLKAIDNERGIIEKKLLERQFSAQVLGQHSL